jgi:potassium-transporting ATPase KdpC subunit
MLADIVRGSKFVLLGMLLCGMLYPALILAVGQAVPGRAAGSLVRGSDGSVVGSSLIGQAFTGAGYFHGRPSAVDFNAASTGGSNLALSNPAFLASLADRVAAVRRDERTSGGLLPADAVTASGSGVDPHISPAYAALQLPRVARVRHLDPAAVRALLLLDTAAPTFGFLGAARVNVLELNLRLDRASPGTKDAGGHGASRHD